MACMSLWSLLNSPAAAGAGIIYHWVQHYSGRGFKMNGFKASVTPILVVLFLTSALKICHSENQYQIS